MSSLKSRAFSYISTYGSNYNTASHKLCELLSSQAYSLDDIFEVINAPEVQSKAIGFFLLACAFTLRSFRAQVNESIQKIGLLLLEELKVVHYD